MFARWRERPSVAKVEASDAALAARAPSQPAA